MNDFNYTDIQKIKDLPHNIIPLLPWGSIEPHGEHLPYTTDTILAEAVANGVVMMTPKKGIRKYVVLPSVSLGSQNLSQINNYPLCIHYNAETQKAVLDDIVMSLKRQGIRKLFIINGHNGNTLKGIVRDLLIKHNESCYEKPKFQIFLCNYLEVVEKCRKRLESLGVPYYDLDEHAAFTETSLMLYTHPELVKLENIANEEKTGKPRSGLWWTPTDFMERSVNSRIGTVGMASADSGEKIFQLVIDELASEIKEIVKK